MLFSSLVELLLLDFIMCGSFPFGARPGFGFCVAPPSHGSAFFFVWGFVDLGGGGFVGWGGGAVLGWSWSWSYMEGGGRRGLSVPVERMCDVFLWHVQILLHVWACGQTCRGDFEGSKLCGRGRGHLVAGSKSFFCSFLLFLSAFSSFKHEFSVLDSQLCAWKKGRLMKWNEWTGARNTAWRGSS